MTEIADDEPLALAVLESYRRRGRAWVTESGTGELAGYLLADDVDGAVHIEQVSVHPKHARRGLGRSLIDHVAREVPGGPPALTLTTFRDVPWNAPYYSRCGFRILDVTEWTPGLRALRVRETANGLDRWPRVCMRREPGSATG